MGDSIGKGQFVSLGLDISGKRLHLFGAFGTAGTPVAISLASGTTGWGLLAIMVLWL